MKPGARHPGGDASGKRKSPRGGKQPEHIFQDSPDVILTVDRKRRILFMSRPMNGPAPAEMIGRDVTLLVPLLVRPWFRRAIRGAFRAGEGSRFQYPTEDAVWWEMRLIPRPGRQRVDEALIIATEVTEARILQARTIRHARLATIGVLATSIAHEINNPNNAILFNASLLARSWQDATPILDEYRLNNGEYALGGLPFDEARAALPGLIEEIRLNTLRVKSIVENLKHLARRDAESLHEVFDLQEPLQAALMILNHKIRKHTDHCELWCVKGGVTVQGNSRQLEQVFINVILNALQSLPARSRQVRIRAGLENDAPDAERVVVTVADQGSGIAPEHLSQLTEPFFTTRGANGGTGLGLSISALIVRNHGGTIHFAANADQGTTVTIHLPRHRPPGAVP
ncbi:MAG: PAS domain-containing protein [Magnetococcales bacterium]|nr:PAS domain-containing protein [Magnetococcales bacterium]